jgi:hypothetical protein
MSVADDTCEWAISEDEQTAVPSCGYDQKGRKFWIIGGKVLCPCPGCGLTIELVRSTSKPETGAKS